MAAAATIDLVDGIVKGELVQDSLLSLSEMAISFSSMLSFLLFVFMEQGN